MKRSTSKTSTMDSPSKKANKSTASSNTTTAATLSETFSFAFSCGWKTRILFVTGTLGGIAHGLALPLVAVFLSQTFETMSRISDDAQQGLDDEMMSLLPSDGSDPMQDIREISYTFLLIGVYSLVSAFFETASFELMASHATRLFQREWFQALIRQDAAYFDLNSASLSADTTTFILKYQQGVGKRFGELIQNVVTGIAGLALGLYSSWRVSLLVFAILPIIAFTSLQSIRRNQSKTQRANECYAQANTTAYFTLSSLRTVLSLNGLPQRIEEYQNATQHALKEATSVLIQLGVFNGSVMASVILLFVGVILFGSFTMYREVVDNGCNPAGGSFNACESTGTDIFSAMLGILFAGQALSQVGNCLEALTGARVAAGQALHVISRKQGSPAKTFYKNKSKQGTITADEEEGGSDDTKTLSRVEEQSSDDNNSKTISAVLPQYQINPLSNEGIRLPDKVEGTIEFKDVTFSYPSRPSVPILQNFSLKIPAGKTVALVGPSGGGKSTVLSLIERFYDPVKGQVCLDGVDIKNLNLTNYRNALGYVGQEPSLFATTIGENIAYGASGADVVTQEQIETAAKRANAHDDFIVSLPDGYETHVGDKGAALSGGQKQRIAIARVLVRQPQILCLDEATSALDAESELHVQEALDSILQEGSMTAVIVAHRLSTIRKADLIYVIAGGGVVESGTHEELMESEMGHYRQLVEKQEGTTTTPNEEWSPPRQPVSRSGSSVSLESSEFLVEEYPAVPLADQVPLLQFRDVQFSYPSRPKKQILKKFNLSVRAGETLALVGPSGGGKSTTVGLVERFYDPSDGVLEFKGNDIKALNPAWYRDQIGYVGQEPTLFPGTIAENIAFGAPGATQEMIEDAARQANIHDFVMSTPEKYDTPVGENGTALSGGQKQRVAIARALIKKPPILLLDEATSALDNESEGVVQQALDRLMQSKEHTVIVIAHKLSTIRECADRIAVVSGGEVLEIGSHEELLAKKRGHYKRLVEAQKRETSLHTLGFQKPLTTTPEEDSEEEQVQKETDKVADGETTDLPGTLTIPQRVKQLARPDMLYIAVGSIGAVLAGASYPLLGLLFAESVHLFFFRVVPCSGEMMSSMLGFENCEGYWDDAADEMQSKSFELALYYALLIVNAVLGTTMVFWGFGKASERLSKRLRDNVFTAIVRQEVGFFDVRSIGELTTQLQESTARLHAFSGSPIRQFFLALTSLLVGLLLSFIVMWPYALLCIGCMVPVVFSQKLRRKKQMGADQGDGKGDTTKGSAGAVMVETLLNMRTVAALGLERHQLDAYEAAIAEGQLHVKRESFISGVMAGIGMFIQRWSNALLYFWGGWLILNYPQHFQFGDFLVSQFSFIFSTLGLAAAMQDMDDRAEVEESAKWIFSILDRQSANDPLSEEGTKLDQLVPPEVEQNLGC